MFFYLFFLFTVVTMTELALLIKLGELIGPLGTIALVLFTGALGASLARWQGMQTLWKLQKGLSQGEAPTETLIDGALILFAGAVLLTPGVLTDLLGFTLLIPPLRELIKPWLKRWFAKRIKIETHQGFQSSGFFYQQKPRYDDGEVVDGEIVHEDLNSGKVIEINQQPIGQQDTQSQK